jgi:hypothetical protein
VKCSVRHPLPTGGFCALSLHHNKFGRVHTRQPSRNPEHSGRYSESLNTETAIDALSSLDRQLPLAEEKRRGELEQLHQTRQDGSL